MGDARQARGVGYGAEHRPVQELLRVEDIVDLLVLQQPVRVNPRPGHIEVLAHEGRPGRNPVADFLLVILRQLRDHCGVHAVQVALELGVLEHHGL